MNTIQVYTLCVIFIYAVFFVTAQDRHSCTNTELPQKGNCISIDDCPSAQESLKLGTQPQNCGVNGNIPLVCCNKESISQQMCKQYETEVKQMLNGDCPIIEPTRTVLSGGMKAHNREFPHMVAIGFNPEDSSTAYLCSGTLISKNFVLTVAHCLISASHGSPKNVRVGDLVLNSDKDDAQPQEIKISKIHIHPDFKRPFKYNDIALLQLEKDVTFSLYAYPACLPKSEEIKNFLQVITTSWGKTSAWDERSDVLIKAGVFIVPKINCTEVYKRNQLGFEKGIDHKTQICAASLGDSYSGDSGGPLQKLGKEFCMYNVLGLTSFGSYSRSYDPVIYTKVFPYIDWIEKIVWP